MKSFYTSHKKEIDQLLTFIIAAAVIFLLVKYALKLFAPFILSFGLSLIISLPVDFITKKSRIPRFVSTLFSMFLVLTALGMASSWLVRVLSKQLISFLAGLPDTIDLAISLFQNFMESYYQFFAFFPDETRNFFEQTLMTLIPSITSEVAYYARLLSISTVKAIPKTLLFIIVTVISTFFMTKDKQKINAFIMKQAPERVKRTFEVLRKDIFGALWGYIRAQGILMCFSGTIAIAGLTIIGYEYSLLIGVLIALFDALPIFGPGFILWPWAAFSLLSGNYRYAVSLMIIYLVIILCRQSIEPKILGSQIGLYPLVTLFSLYVGLSVFGPIGLIIGPLLVIIVRSLQNAGLLPNWND